MGDRPGLIFAAILIVVYGLISKLEERSPLTAPMFFVAMGILVSPLGIDLFKVEVRGDFVQLLTEATLTLILFIDASTINLKQLIKDRSVPLRLLCIGLPLSMLLGTGAAYVIYPQINIWSLTLMALILSPTDAALGQAVVKSKEVPQRVQRWISVESGLNDGIALPPILACIAVITLEGSGHGGNRWFLFLLQQVFLGAVIGGLVGWIGGYLLATFSAKGWMNSTFQRLVSCALAILCFCFAEMVHGNGLIAAFSGGLMLGYCIRDKHILEKIQSFGEAEGQQLTLFVFLIFAMVLVPAAYIYWDVKAWLYAIASITIIRMLPVFLCLTGQDLDIASKLFVGWFGPRGIASILYLLLVIAKLGLEGYEIILSVIVLTVLLSVFLHGISAVPLSRIYSRNHK